MEQRELLTVPEAADRVGITRTVMWRHVNQGHLPSIKAGRQRLVYDDDLAHFIATRRTPGRPKKPKAQAPNSGA